MGARWTTAEVATLRRMAGVAPIEEIAHQLGRSIAAIKRAGADHRISLRRAPFGRRMAEEADLRPDEGAVALIAAIVRQCRADARTDFEARAWLYDLKRAVGRGAWELSGALPHAQPAQMASAAPSGEGAQR
jgi:hypothetical protein